MVEQRRDQLLDSSLMSYPISIPDSTSAWGTLMKFALYNGLAAGALHVPSSEE